eukprot:scpid78075/ scgid27345/ 
MDTTASGFSSRMRSTLSFRSPIMARWSFTNSGLIGLPGEVEDSSGFMSSGCGTSTEVVGAGAVSMLPSLLTYHSRVVQRKKPGTCTETRKRGMSRSTDRTLKVIILVLTVLYFSLSSYYKVVEH